MNIKNAVFQTVYWGGILGKNEHCTVDVDFYNDGNFVQVAAMRQAMINIWAFDERTRYDSKILSQFDSLLHVEFKKASQP